MKNFDIMRFLWYNLYMEKIINTEETITISKAEYDSLQLQISWLIEQLKMSKHRQFDPSSEQTDIDFRQLNLFGDNEIAPPPPESDTEEITYKRKKQKGKREDDLSGLPVERIDYELSEAERVCSECGDTMRDIGVEIRRELKLIPARVVVLEYATHTYACRNCEYNDITTPFAKANSPKPLIGFAITCGAYCYAKICERYALIQNRKRFSI